MIKKYRTIAVDIAPDEILGATYSHHLNGMKISHQAPDSQPKRPALWGATGFLIGIMFWGIFGPIVFSLPSSESWADQITFRTLSAKASSSEFDRRRLDTCTELVLDKIRRSTYSKPCTTILSYNSQSHRKKREVAQEKTDRHTVK